MTAVDVPYNVSRCASLMRACEIRELLKLLDRLGMISFASGIPDPARFDLESFGKAHEASLAASGTALQYSASEGHPPLRRWIGQRMSELGADCTKDIILVTHGSRQGLDLIGKLLLDPASPLITEAPTYLGALQSFAALEPDFTTVALLRTCSRDRRHVGKADLPGSRFREPVQQEHVARRARGNLGVGAQDRRNPRRGSGLCGPTRRGRKNPRHSRARDHVQRLDRAFAVPLLRNLLQDVSPGMRVGWVCGPASLIHRLTLIKQASDLPTATVNQQVLYRAAETAFDVAVEPACATCASRRDLMLNALGRHAPVGVAWTQPAGGLFNWLARSGHRRAP